MKRKPGRSCRSFVANRPRDLLSALLVLLFANLLLTGCSGLYTHHPAADRKSSSIDPRLEGLWQSKFERSKWDWAVEFDSEDHVTGKLSLFRSHDGYRHRSEEALLNVFSVRCIRKDNAGVCSGELDGQPIPKVKEDMRGWLTLAVGDTWSPGADLRHVIGAYEIQASGDIAIYGNVKLDVLEEYVTGKGLAFSRDRGFLVTEPAPGLTMMLDDVTEFFSAKATAVMTRVEPETTEATVVRLAARLSSGSSQSRYDAALQLGQFGEQAAAAVPAFNRMIWDELASEGPVDVPVMRAAVQALADIGVAASDSLAALEALWTLNNPELEVPLEQAIETLRQKQ